MESEPAAGEHLFVERRRTRPKEQLWHEALQPVEQLLAHYEETNQRLIHEEESWRRFFQESPVGLFQICPQGRPLRVNDAMAALCGYASPEELMGGVPHLGEKLVADAQQWSDLECRLEEQQPYQTVETEMECFDGLTKWVELHVRVVRDPGGRTLHYEGAAEDISERKSAEQRIHQLAYYDRVTGLPNRALFDERLHEALADAHCRGGEAGLLLLELDRFKIINDSLGESFGDRLLGEIATRILSAAGDRSTVARISGAEFAIILPEIVGSAEGEAVARKVMQAFAKPFAFMGHSLKVSCSLGISLYPKDGSNADALLKRADVAMYSARDAGPNELRFFNEEMNANIRQRLMLENDLGRALERNQLFLVYQPQVDIRTGAIRGLEALLRWRHPELGLVPPVRFIGVAESAGLIVSIGEWVLRSACTQARAWQLAGLPPVPVAVNVSALQFRHQEFVDLVRNVLLEAELEPKYLELELTEGLLLSNEDVMFAITQELREMGVKLTIDDFGTGYSSLGYLRQFKVNRLKIDRSFVRDVPMNADDAAITTAIIQMAKALNLEVVAEGVENERQLAFLRSQQCYEIQGYYYSKPVPVEQVALQLQSTFLQPA